MAIHVDTALAPAILKFRIDGEWPTPDEQSTIRRNLMADGHLIRETRALIDLRDAAVQSSAQASAIVAALIRDDTLPLVRAYLVGANVYSGLAHQLVALAPAPSKAEIFASEGEALLWLNYA